MIFRWLKKHLVERRERRFVDKVLKYSREYELEAKKARFGESQDELVLRFFRGVEDEHEEGAQVDLLIDRSDQVINLCEIKFSNKPYLLTKEYDEELRRKMSVFEYATKTRKAVRIAMITSYGLVRNAYANDIPSQLTMDDLFV